MALRPTSVWVETALATGVATVLIIPKPGINGGYLTGLINSKVMQALYKLLFGSLSLAGGYMRFGVPQFRRLPIPKASKSDQLAIAKLAERCGDAKGIDCDKYVLELDERVARLYGIDLRVVAAESAPSRRRRK